MVWPAKPNIHYLALPESLQTPSLEHWFPKCGPHSRGISITWNLVKKCKFSPHPKSTQSESQMGPVTCALVSLPRGFWFELKFKITKHIISPIILGNHIHSLPGSQSPAVVFKFLISPYLPMWLLRKGALHVEMHWLRHFKRSHIKWHWWLRVMFTTQRSINWFYNTLEGWYSAYWFRNITSMFLLKLNLFKLIFDHCRGQDADWLYVAVDGDYKQLSVPSQVGPHLQTATQGAGRTCSRLPIFPGVPVPDGAADFCPLLPSSKEKKTLTRRHMKL